MDLKERFEIWRDVYALQIDFLRELGNYKLNAAKSDLVAAVASNQLAVARMKALIAQELQGALRRLHQMEGRTATKVKRLTTMARNAAYIQNGDDTFADATDVGRLQSLRANGSYRTTGNDDAHRSSPRCSQRCSIHQQSCPFRTLP